MTRDRDIVIGIAGAAALGTLLLRRNVSEASSTERADVPVALKGLTWPVPALLDRGELRRPRVSSGFGMRGTHFHWGVDILYRRKPGEPGRSPHGSKRYYMPAGVPAIAIDDGVVTVSKDITTGGFVRIDHGRGIKSDYLHLDPRLVVFGERVRAGQRVGMIGWDKRRAVDLYHLHFQLWIAGKRVDPLPHLSRWRRFATVAAAETRRVA